MLPASGVLKARPRFWPTRSLGDGAMVELLRCQPVAEMPRSRTRRCELDTQQAKCQDLPSDA